MIHDEQENYALGSVNVVHVLWDTEVNPTQTTILDHFPGF